VTTHPELFAGQILKSHCAKSNCSHQQLTHLSGLHPRPLHFDLHPLLCRDSGDVWLTAHHHSPELPWPLSSYFRFSSTLPTRSRPHHHGRAAWPPNDAPPVSTTHGFTPSPVAPCRWASDAVIGGQSCWRWMRRWTTTRA
jgi:hypothetical protein